MDRGTLRGGAPVFEPAWHRAVARFSAGKSVRARILHANSPEARRARARVKKRSSKRKIPKAVAASSYAESVM